MIQYDYCSNLLLEISYICSMNSDEFCLRKCVCLVLACDMFISPNKTLSFLIGAKLHTSYSQMITESPYIYNYIYICVCVSSLNHFEINLQS